MTTWHAPGTYYARNREKLLAKANARNKLKRPVRAEIRSCSVCAKQFEVGLVRGPVPAYCSRPCGDKARRANARVTERHQISCRCRVCGSEIFSQGRKLLRVCIPCRTKDCEVCGNSYTRLRGVLGRVCSRTCGQLLGASLSVAGIKWKACIGCGIQFQSRGRANQKYCTRECYRPLNGSTAEAHLDRRAANRAKRKYAHWELVERRKVYERDGWICQLCHCPVDRTLSWPDKMCASLDHITPISKGGPHTYANVQLAHFRCNSIKQDRPVEGGGGVSALVQASPMEAPPPGTASIGAAVQVLQGARQDCCGHSR